MISLIIPMYNVEEYIVDCLKSLEGQLYQNFEVIIVDDGSVDKSLKIVKQYMNESDLQINIVTQENLGVSAARNKGISLAKGEYVAFIDADDMIYPEYLLLMLSSTEQKKADVVFCQSESANEDFKYDYIKNSIREEKIDLQIENNLSALRSYLYGGFVSGACTLLVRLDFLKRNRIIFREGYKYSEDLNFVWKILDKSRDVVIIKKPLYIYRTRNSSAMSRVDKSRFDGLKLMQELEVYFEKENKDFYKEFKKYGVARWIWATLWQIALASQNYNDFKKNIKEIKARYYLKKMISFPNFKIKMSSLIYVICPVLYYFFVKVFVGKIVKRKFN